MGLDEITMVGSKMESRRGLKTDSLGSPTLRQNTGERGASKQD